jgi:hypothetical protein
MTHVEVDAGMFLQRGFAMLTNEECRLVRYAIFLLQRLAKQ